MFSKKVLPKMSTFELRLYVGQILRQEDAGAITHEESVKYVREIQNEIKRRNDLNKKHASERTSKSEKKSDSPE